MRNHVSIISLFILLFVPLAGCNMGPTTGQTRQAVEATFRSLASSFEDVEGLDDIQVNGIYANAADVTVENEEGSVVTTMSLFMRENELQIYGSSTIANYKDAGSDYIVNGELTYSFWYPNGRIDSAYGEVSGSVNLSGGKIKNLEFSASGHVDGNEEYDTTADYYPVHFTHEGSFFEVLEAVGEKVSG